MKEKRPFILLFLTLFLARGASDSYTSGLTAYREGKDGEAQIYLEQSLTENPGNDGAHLYLGILYQKAGLTEKAEEVMRTGSALDGTHHYELAFNLANLYHAVQRYDEAEEQYTYVAVSLSPLRTKALLNRANLGVNRRAYQNALEDYLNYLMEEPETPQRSNIEKMVSLLRQQLDEEERVRLEEEERVRLEQEAQKLKEEEEARRLEDLARQKALEEQTRLEEEARQRALMEDILNTLSTAGEETKSFTADSEKVEEVFEESDLED